MTTYSEDQLLWWCHESAFDHTSWWMSGNQLNDEDPRLLEGLRQNGTKIYKPGPIYWEILRRHPELPALKAAAQACLGEPNPVAALGERLDMEHPAALFYLLSLYRKPWHELESEGDASLRFAPFLPDFLAAVSAPDVPIRYPNPVVDLSTGPEHLGVLASLESFCSMVDPYYLEEPTFPAPDTPGPSQRVRVLRLDGLEKELERLGMDLWLLAVRKGADESSIKAAFQNLASKRSAARDTTQQTRGHRTSGRLQPDILVHLHKIALEGKCRGDTRKKVLKYFREIGFSKMIAALESAS